MAKGSNPKKSEEDEFKKSKEYQEYKVFFENLTEKDKIALRDLYTPIFLNKRKPDPANINFDFSAVYYTERTDRRSKFTREIDEEIIEELARIKLGQESGLSPIFDGIPLPVDNETILAVARYRRISFKVSRIQTRNISEKYSPQNYSRMQRFATITKPEKSLYEKYLSDIDGIDYEELEMMLSNPQNGKIKNELFADHYESKYEEACLFQQIEDLINKYPKLINLTPKNYDEMMEKWDWAFNRLSENGVLQLRRLKENSPEADIFSFIHRLQDDETLPVMYRAGKTNTQGEFRAKNRYRTDDTSAYHVEFGSKGKVETSYISVTESPLIMGTYRSEDMQVGAPYLIDLYKLIELIYERAYEISDRGLHGEVDILKQVLEKMREKNSDYREIEKLEERIKKLESKELYKYDEGLPEDFLPRTRIIEDIEDRHRKENPDEIKKVKKSGKRQSNPSDKGVNWLNASAENLFQGILPAEAVIALDPLSSDIIEIASNSSNYFDLIRNIIGRDKNLERTPKLNLFEELKKIIEDGKIEQLGLNPIEQDFLEQYYIDNVPIDEIVVKGEKTTEFEYDMVKATLRTSVIKKLLQSKVFVEQLGLGEFDKLNESIIMERFSKGVGANHSTEGTTQNEISGVVARDDKVKVSSNRKNPGIAIIDSKANKKIIDEKGQEVAKTTIMDLPESVDESGITYKGYNTDRSVYGSGIFQESRAYLIKETPKRIPFKAVYKSSEAASQLTETIKYLKKDRDELVPEDSQNSEER